MINIGMTVCSENPHAYKEMCFIMNLPSQGTLRKKKTAVSQKTGISDYNMNWMVQEAMSKPSPDMYGGIIFNEMAIQPRLAKRGSNPIGFVESGKEHDTVYKDEHGKVDQRLATHVLQFVDIGLRGLRWPLAHFPKVQASAGDIDEALSIIMFALMSRGFTICYILENPLTLFTVCHHGNLFN